MHIYIKVHILIFMLIFNINRFYCDRDFLKCSQIKKKLRNIFWLQIAVFLRSITSASFSQPSKYFDFLISDIIILITDISLIYMFPISERYWYVAIE